MSVIYLQLSSDPNAPYVAYNWSSVKPPVKPIPPVNKVYVGNL